MSEHMVIKPMTLSGMQDDAYYPMGNHKYEESRAQQRESDWGQVYTMNAEFFQKPIALNMRPSSQKMMEPGKVEAYWQVSMALRYIFGGE